jgi:hypothetical protein
MGRMPGLAKVVRGTIAILRFPGVVHGAMAPLAPCEPRWVTMPISHKSEQGTLTTTHESLQMCERKNHLNRIYG